MKKVLVALGIVVAVLVAAAVGLGVWLDADRLGGIVLDRINRTEGVSLEARTFRVGLWSGLEIRDAHLEADLSSGRVEGDVDRLLLDYELWPLLRRQVVVHRVRVDAPRLRVTSGAGAASKGGSGGGTRGGEGSREGTAPEEGSATGTGLELQVDRIEVHDATLEVTTAGAAEPDLRVGRLDLDLEGVHLPAADQDPLLGVAAHGRLDARDVSSGDLDVRRARGSLVIEGGQLRLEDVDLEAENGDLVLASLTADLRKDPFSYRLALHGGLDVNAIMDGGSPGLGPAQLELAADGSGPELEALEGKGVLHLDSGSLPVSPLVAKLEALVGTSILSGKTYRPTDITYRVADGGLQIEPFELAMEGLELGAAGSVKFAGPVDLDLDIGLPRSAVDSKAVPRELLDQLTDAGGLTHLFLAVRGTLDAPEVAFDQRRMEKAARDAIAGKVERRVETEKKKLTNELQDQLRKLLAGDKDQNE